MFAKKPQLTATSSRGYQKELEQLYARRSAINSLIQSLEEYDRFRVRRIDERKRKTA